MPRHVALALLLPFVFSLQVHAQTPADPTPIVVAIDTSRSLSATALTQVRATLGPALQALPAGTPVGLLAFDDEPRWEVELGASPAAVAAALETLEPRGNFTLLNDALFVATRALEKGGVILLVTDGRDENSATTVEDIARRSESQGVRIVALGVGRVVEERALRRLALLTSGEYVGTVDAVDPATLGGKVEDARARAQPPRRAAAPWSPRERSPRRGWSPQRQGRRWPPCRRRSRLRPRPGLGASPNGFCPSCSGWRCCSPWVCSPRSWRDARGRRRPSRLSSMTISSCTAGSPSASRRRRSRPRT